MTSTLALTALTKSFDAFTAVDGIDLDLPAGSFTALLGPSGCGKSTTLQMIAGLLAPDAGRIELDGVDLGTMPTERRPVSLVFQKPLLFPHLSVGQNIAFGLRMRRTPRAEIGDRVTAVLDQVQLAGLADRRPHELSGGQEQRVALARALVLSPSLLLLDEPFSQLDASLRAEMRALVRELHDSTGVTTLFVTHDQAEAIEIADRIVVMLNGRVEACDTPERLYVAPPTLATARFLGTGNELRGTATESGFTIGGTTIEIAPQPHDGPAVLVVRPEVLQLTAPTPDSPTPDVLSVTVEAIRFAGSHLAVTTGTDDGQCVAVHVPVGTRIGAGDRVNVQIPRDLCIVFTSEPDASEPDGPELDGPPFNGEVPA